MTEMHKQFGEWYARVDLGDDAERLDARWKAISSLADKADIDDIEHLMDLFLRRPGAVAGQAGEKVRLAIKEHVPSFPTSGNSEELALIGEVGLALIMDSRSKLILAGEAACCVYAGLAGGLITIDSATDLLERAIFTKRRQGIAIRTRTKLDPATKCQVAALDFSDCISDEGNMSSSESAREVLSKVATKVTTAINKVAVAARRERELIISQIKIQDEELDLLWWASNGLSRETGKPIKSLSDGARGLVAAVEAAKLTQFEPGPSSIAGLLEKAGVAPRKKISICDAINAADEEWLRSIAISHVSPRTPLHYGVAKRLEIPDADAWPAAWGSVTGISSDKTVSELVLADLFYNERVVLGQYGSA